MWKQKRGGWRQFPIFRGLFWLVTPLLLGVLLGVLSLPRAQAQLTVAWQDGHLSVQAEKVPLAQVLQEIASQTGVAVQGLEGLDEEVSLRFSALPLRAGLQQLLAPVNYFLVEKTIPVGDARPVLLMITGWRRTLSADAAGSQAEGKLAGRGGGDDWQRLDPNLRLARVQETNSADLQQDARILFAATQDSDPSIRQLAYDRLYEKGEKEKVADLLQQDARSADSDRRRTAIESLGKLFASEAADILRNATTDENPDVRHAAFQQLARIDSAETVQVLRDRFTHPDAAVRLMAIEAMAARGEASAREAAMAALSDSDEAVRSKARGLLQELEAGEGSGTED
jgi:hypothetical protein